MQNCIGPTICIGQEFSAGFLNVITHLSNEVFTEDAVCKASPDTH